MPTNSAFARRMGGATLMCVAAALLALPARGRGGRTEDATPVPPPASKNVVMLFAGKSEDVTSHWKMRYADNPATWQIREGVLQVGKGDIATKQEFGDFHLHVEFKTPLMPDAKGQARGNSGIGLHGRYEIQILDSYGIESPGKGDCGSVYNQTAPLLNASRPPQQWQTYDILFRAPRFDSGGKVTELPRVSVIHNGIPVQNNTEIPKPTGIQFQQYQGMSKTGPIVFQDHGNAVEFRNVWILPLPEKGSDKY